MHAVHVDTVISRAVKQTVCNADFAPAHTYLDKIGNGRHFPRGIFFGRERNVIRFNIFTILKHERQRIIEALL